jgi:predicted PurR-regulated permease PerM
MTRPSPSETGLKLGLLPTVFATVAALYFAQDVLIPLAVAVLLAFVLAPAVTWLERAHAGRAVAVLTVVGTALIVLGTIGWTVERQFVEVAEKLPDYGANIRSKLLRFQGAATGGYAKAARGVEETLRSIGTTQSSTAPSAMAGAAPLAQAPDSRPGEPALPRVSPQNPLPVREYTEPSSPLQIVGHYMGRLLSPLATGGLIVVFVIFMLLNRKDLRDRMIRLVGHGRLNLTTQALDDAATRISRYLLMQLIVNVAYGAPIAIGLYLIGIPNALLWGLIATLLRFIPYIGAWIAASVPVFLSIAMFDDMQHFLLTVGLYVVIELISNNIIEPWLFGSSAGLSPMAILVSAVFWTWLWGPIGLLLATPLSVIVVVLGKHVPQLGFLDVMLGDEPVLEPSVRLYQRLLSLDQEDAGELLHVYRKEKGLERMYDDIMVPALAMAERDRHTQQLDVERENFVRQAMRDLIEEMGDSQRTEDASAALAEARDGPDGTAPVVRPSMPQKPQVTVLCLPAHDEADEIVGMMLAQLLELKGQKAIAASQISLASEMLDLVQKHDAAAVCISALPPAALAHSRYLCKRLQARSPELSSVVGLWTSKAETKKSLDRLGCGGTVRLVTSLGAAIAEIQQVVRQSAHLSVTDSQANAQPASRAGVDPSRLLETTPAAGRTEQHAAG